MGQERADAAVDIACGEAVPGGFMGVFHRRCGSGERAVPWEPPLSRSPSLRRIAMRTPLIAPTLAALLDLALASAHAHVGDEIYPFSGRAGRLPD